MKKKSEMYTHMDYRNAKIIHLVEKDKTERFVYKKQDISKQEADEITSLYLAKKEKKKMDKEIAL